jgi:uncharacterized membrane protein YjgN (DUF898 family)
MTAFGTTAIAAAQPPEVGRAKFVGPLGPFWRLLVRGALLLMVTLGIYRFWLVTDIRRYLWSNTEIAGDALEYLGTGVELLLGFLIAIAILVPIYAGLSIGSLGLGRLGAIVPFVSFALLALLGQFAVYRARRYRLTRTMFRGLRFHQTGSAWRYAVCAIFWMAMSALTLGLAYPWGQASLERYKMRNTFYGDLQARFEGSGTRLFARGFLLWAIVMVPVLIGTVVLIAAIDWTAIAAVLKAGTLDPGRIEGADPSVALVILFPFLFAAWLAVAGAVLYPAFQAITMKWWLAGLRFGEITVSTRLRMRSVYAVYVRFLWHALAFAAVVLTLFGLGALAVGMVGTASFESSVAAQIAASVGVVVLYVATALGFSTIYHVTVRLGLWRVGFESIDLAGLRALDRVKAVPQSASAMGEGLIDALNVGGY